jgi:hypothetical protein
MKLVLLLLLSILPLEALAYIGPGLGMGTIGVVLGVLFSIVMVFISIIWYPFKRLLKQLRKKQQKVDKAN